MYEYHVTYGVFKKIIKSGSNIARSIHDPIKKAFSLDLSCSLHLQYWHAKHNDWVDCEESDEINEDTKLNVCQNVHDLQKLESSSLSTAPSSNVGLCCSTPSINLTSSTVFEEYSIVDQQPSQQRNIDEFPGVYELPQFPLWLQYMLDTSSSLCKEPKCRRAVIEALFEDLLHYSYYPTSRMFQETARALVEAHPILKDKQSANGQPHDSWVLRLRDKFKKFRSRHAELCNAEELKRMKEKFGNKRDRRRLDTDNSIDNSLTSVKRMKKTFYVVQLDSDIFKEKMVVPSIWLDKNNTFCLLPPITDIEVVETLAKVQCTPKHGWQMQRVSFIQSFDTYCQAKENITKGKPVMIKLEEEGEEEHHKEVRGKRKRKIPLFLEEYSVESGDDIEEGRGSTQDGCSMEDSVVPGPLIVKIETMQHSNAPEIHQQPGIDTTHNKNSSSVHSSIQHGNQLQVAGSSSPTIRFFCSMDFVASKLQEWGFPSLIETFQSHGIDEEALLLLDKESIRTLVPQIGLSLKVQKKIFDYKKIQEQKITTEEVNDTGNETVYVQNLFKVESCVPNESAQPSDISISDNIQTSVTKFEVLNTVMDKCQEIGQTLQSGNPISYLEKLKLSRVVVKNCLIKKCGVFPSTQQKEQLAKELISVFPPLKGVDGTGYEQWFCKGVKNKLGKTTPNRGYLEENLRNWRQRLSNKDKQKYGIRINSNKGTKRALSTTTSQDISSTTHHLSIDSLEKQQWLKENSAPAATVLQCMSETCVERRNHFSPTSPSISQILEQWPKL